MPTHFIRKLEQFTSLSLEDKQALTSAAQQNMRLVPVRGDIVNEGDRPKRVNLMLEGFACRYKTLEDGRRQIVAFLIPGDMCDARAFILKEADHSVGALSPVRVAQISGEAFVELADRSPRLSRALWWNSLVDEAIAREWVLNVGRRDAHERMAHLFCEFYIRMNAVGLCQRMSCDFPMTQAELGDALALSEVHTNRTLQELRSRGLLVLSRKRLQVPNLQALKDAGLFNPNYLHLDRDSAASA